MGNNKFRIPRITTIEKVVETKEMKLSIFIGQIKSKISKNFEELNFYLNINTNEFHIRMSDKIDKEMYYSITDILKEITEHMIQSIDVKSIKFVSDSLETQTIFFKPNKT